MKRAFTLIELLIVVAIIGILAAIAVPNFLNAQVRAKIARVKGDMTAHATAINMYMLDNGSQPSGPNQVSGSGVEYKGIVVWKQLTTPIAYVSPSVMIDPFIDFPNHNQFELYAGNFHPLRFYQYRNIKYDYEIGAQNNEADPTGQWLTRSAGPDHASLHWPSRLFKSMAYNPSNGVTSGGDIIRCDKGFVGEVGRDNHYTD